MCFWDLHRAENKNAAENRETIYATVDSPEAAAETWWSSPGTYSMRLYTPSYWKVLDATGNRATNWQTVPGDTLGIGNGDVRTNDFFPLSDVERSGTHIGEHAGYAESSK